MEGFFSGNIEDVPDPIIARTNPADNRATLEVWMNNKMRYSPKALVIFGGNRPVITPAFLDSNIYIYQSTLRMSHMSLVF